MIKVFFPLRSHPRVAIVFTLLSLVLTATGCLHYQFQTQHRKAETLRQQTQRAKNPALGSAETRTIPAGEDDYDPIKLARANIGNIENYEATVPSQCYTETAGVANPCWTCHTASTHPNDLHDWELQEEYAFSDVAMTNYWSNLFIDRTAAIAEISDEEALRYVRTDNYNALKTALEKRPDYPGYVPDLDFDLGFDHEGFAKDGSHWRAIRYKPFLGTFWPTNGNTDDVFIRLPEHFRTRDDVYDRELYKANLAILEAAIAAGPNAGEAKNFTFITEPISEDAARMDLNGDGVVGGIITTIRGFPERFAGDAADEDFRRYIYPEGVEFLHSVRYIDPDAPGLIAQRMKELRYSRKTDYLDEWGTTRQYELEYNEKEEGELPVFAGSAMVGLRNDFAWQLQGFIEDELGRLRLQTDEEHQFCMGCHSALGVTVDQTFTLARKVPGAAGWAYQNIEGIRDVPQQGHEKGEIATYFERTTGGDEFRANTEILERFFPGGEYDEKEVTRAAPGGDRDIVHLIGPSRERAMLLNKAYMTLVREQRFEYGRDTVIGAIEKVHTEIENGDTDLAPTGKVFQDGKLWLDWFRR